VYCYEIREKFSESNYLFLYGEWSVPIVHLSFYSGLLNSIYSSTTAMTLTIFIFLILVTVIMFVIVKVYRKYQKISDIKAIYPEGLNPNDPSMIYMREGSVEGVKNLDLLKNHDLADIIEEEIKLQESKNDAEGLWECEKIADVINQSKNNNFVFHPSVANDEGDCFHSFLVMDEKCSSSVSNPINSDIFSGGKVAHDVGYMKMYEPRFVRAKSISKNVNNNKTVDGYLDMTGKSPEKCTLQNTSTEIKSLIENTSRNNGYIDRRSIQKNPFPVNASGYVAFKKS
jgi:hypothetical protein